MKYHYCSRCNYPFKRLFNCKYEKNDNDYFLLCTKCAFECSEITIKITQIVCKVSFQNVDIKQVNIV